jgi:hypothetical protein
VIGIISSEAHVSAVREFFELFKTPWEFWREGVTYDVVIASSTDIPEHLITNALVIYSAERSGMDETETTSIEARVSGNWIEWDGGDCPVYGKLLVFRGDGEPIVTRHQSTSMVGMRLANEGRPTVRIGFDLFYEVYFLLSQGQPSENAQTPAMDRQIALLRELLLGLGTPLVEVLPAPNGYEFVACLTHDVDFVGIRDHWFDHTMFGFLFRCFVGSLQDVLRGRLSWKKCLRNWAAGLSLPLVLINVVDDFWLEFDRYREMEKGLGSTFYFIPFPNTPGLLESTPAPARRAAKYDLTQIRGQVQELVDHDCEVGLHGIDAWHDQQKGKTESSRIREFTGESQLGIRMHWLYWGKESATVLDASGFDYDSTSGFNNAVGFRAGTTQVFRPLGVKHLLELPLNIQDSALFYPDRMNLSERDALDTCKNVIRSVLSGRGALTLNWHTRSLSPERLWGEFYATLLNELHTHRVWFGTAHQIVEWFRYRRKVSFSSAESDETAIDLAISDSADTSGHSFAVRFYHPRTDDSSPSRCYTDVEWNGQERFSIPYSQLAS